MPSDFTIARSYLRLCCFLMLSIAQIYVPMHLLTLIRLYNHRKSRGLKLRIEREEGLYYLCSESEGTVQLRGYSLADLRLCCRKCKKENQGFRDVDLLCYHNMHYMQIIRFWCLLIKCFGYLFKKRQTIQLQSSAVTLL